MLKILQILIMLDGFVINAYNVEIMNNRENFQSFNINCLNSQNRKFKATINIWTENINNPFIDDIFENKKYEFQGKYQIYFFEYLDETGIRYINFPDRVSNAFYGLCKKIEKTEIKLLIKGCSLGYYMIPRLQYSIYTTPLILGRRIEKELSRISIFEPENDVKKIVTIENKNIFIKHG
jgi:hypothetical protein